MQHFMSDNIYQNDHDKGSQDNLTEIAALLRKQVQLAEENVKAANASTDSQQLRNLRVKITRMAALIIVSAGLAALLVHRGPSSQPPRQIQSFGEAFFALAIFGGLFIALVDFISSLLRRAIWGQVNTVSMTATLSPVPTGIPTGISRAKYWAGFAIVLVIASGLLVFGVQGRRLAAQQQQRRDCLQLSSLRFQENPIPLPPPPPPLPPPGMNFNAELEDKIKKLQEQHQKLADERRKWETNELPKIRERRMALEKKLAGVQCDALH